MGRHFSNKVSSPGRNTPICHVSGSKKVPCKTENLSSAPDALAAAKRNFAEQSKSLQEAGIQEISDEEKENPMDVTTQTETTKGIYEGLSLVVSNLQDLSEKAEIEEQQAIRQRKDADILEEDDGNATLPSSRSAM